MTNPNYHESCGSFFTGASVQAGIEFAHVNLPLAQPPRVTRLAAARKVIDAVDTRAVPTQVARTVVFVDLAARARKTQRTIACEAVEGVAAGAAVVAGVARAVV